jgi:hypothetical protein
VLLVFSGYVILWPHGGTFGQYNNASRPRDSVPAMQFGVRPSFEPEESLGAANFEVPAAVSLRWMRRAILQPAPHEVETVLR